MIHNMTSWNVMSPMIAICLNLLQETSLSLTERENTSNPNSKGNELNSLDVKM